MRQPDKVCYQIPPLILKIGRGFLVEKLFTDVKKKNTHRSKPAIRLSLRSEKYQKQM